MGKQIFYINGYEVTPETFIYSARGVGQKGGYPYYAAARYAIEPRGGAYKNVYHLKLKWSSIWHRSKNKCVEIARAAMLKRREKGGKAFLIPGATSTTKVKVLDADTDFFRITLQTWEGAPPVKVALTREDIADLEETCQRSSMVQIGEVLCERPYAYDIVGMAKEFFSIEEVE